MGEFKEVASEIARRLSESEDHKGISPNELTEIVSDSIGNQPINCYPGIPGYGCCELAFFISLSSPTLVKGKRGHLSFKQALEKIVHHMQGLCVNETKKAILLTDSWDASACDEWKENLLQIKRVSLLEIYLLSGPNASGINL